MEPGPFMANRWGKMEAVTEFIFFALQNHYGHEIKRRLLLGRKAMTILDRALKSKDIY